MSINTGDYAYIDSDNFEFIEKEENVTYCNFNRNASEVFNHDEVINNRNNGYNYKNKKTSERGRSKMDENQILEKYMDKVDQDRRDQEQRLSNSIQSMEQRLNEDRKLMEQRIVEERRLSEDRMEKRFNETMEALKETNKKMDSTNKWITGTCIATIIGIAAMAVTIVVAFIQLKAGQ